MRKWNEIKMQCEFGIGCIKTNKFITWNKVKPLQVKMAQKYPLKKEKKTDYIRCEKLNVSTDMRTHYT